MISRDFPSNLTMIFQVHSFNERLIAVFFFIKSHLSPFIRQFFAHHDFTRFFLKIFWFEIWIFWYLFTFLLSLYRYWDLSEKNLLIICAKAPNYSQFLFKAWQWNYWQIKTKLSQAVPFGKVENPSLDYFLKDWKMKLKTNKMSDHHARSEVKSTRKLNSPWLETTCLRHTNIEKRYVLFSTKVITSPSLS